MPVPAAVAATPFADLSLPPPSTRGKIRFGKRVVETATPSSDLSWPLPSTRGKIRFAKRTNATTAATAATTPAQKPTTIAPTPARPAPAPTPAAPPAKRRRVDDAPSSSSGPTPRSQGTSFNRREHAEIILLSSSPPRQKTPVSAKQRSDGVVLPGVVSPSRGASPARGASPRGRSPPPRGPSPSAGGPSPSAQDDAPPPPARDASAPIRGPSSLPARESASTAGAEKQRHASPSARDV